MRRRFGLLLLAGGLMLGPLLSWCAAEECTAEGHTAWWFAELPAAGFHSGANHTASPGYLGIDVRDVTEESVNALHLHDARGAEIIRVDHDGPAGKMGLREHDVVLQMNGVFVDGEETLRRMLRETAPGRSITFIVSRDGQQLSMSTQMADRAQVERQAWEQHLATSGPQAPTVAMPSEELAGPGSNLAPAPASKYSKSFLGTLLMSPSYTGAMLETMGPQLADYFGVSGGSGLLVRSVAPNSPAAMAGLRAGDIVMKTNAMPVGTPSHWTKTIREAKGKPVTVTILRDRQEKTLTLLPDSKKRSSLDLPAEPYTPVMQLYVVTARNTLTEL